MPSVAETLRTTRESRKLSVQQVADLTKIKTEHVRDLESGSFKGFAAPVYIRGFVRTYATLLKLDVAKVMAALDEELSQTEEFSAPPSLTGGAKGPLDFVMLQLSRLNWRVLGWVAGLVLLISVGLWSLAAWKTHQTRDPLADVKPAIYRPPGGFAGDTLPLPVSTNPPQSAAARGPQQ